MSDHIPEEVMANILLRLSVNDLVRCRRVSKQWHSIIDNTHFISLQLQRSISTNSNAALYLQDRKSPILFWKRRESPTLYWKQNYTSDVNFFSIQIHYEPSQPARVFLMGSCHGLVCFSLFDHPDDFVVFNPSTGERHTVSCPMDDFVVFNPSTGERHTVSCPMVERREGERLVAYGFGYDKSSDDYKMVRILQTNAEIYGAEIFSVRSKGFFRKIPLPTANWLDYARKFMGVFVGGSIHWCINTNSVVIHAIDLVSNTYHHFQGPDYKFCQTVLDNMNVGIVDTHLSVCGALKEQSKIGIWVMEEHGNPESWNMLYCIDHQWSLPYSLTPVGSNSDKILLMLDWNRFVWYDPINVADGTILADNLKWRYGSYEPIYCLESLVKIFPDKGADVKKDAYGKQLKRIAVSAQEIPQSSHPDFLELRSLNALMFEDYSEPCSAEEEFYAEIFNLRF
ncbi:F-box protein CPR1 [Linum perenne]